MLYALAPALHVVDLFGTRLPDLLRRDVSRGHVFLVTSPFSPRRVLSLV